MQPIERYALVTLLFLIVLIVVGALWDDGEVDAAARPDQQVARVEQADRGSARGARERGRSQALPLNMREPAAEVSRQRTATPQRQGAAPAGTPSRPVQPINTTARPGGSQPAPAYIAPSSGASSRPAAPSAEDLDGSLRPVPTGDVARGPASWERASRARENPVRPSRTGRAQDSRARSGAVEDTTPKTRPYIIKGGDSLGRIAKRELGDAGAVDRIASLNGIAKPYTIYAGRTLLLPVGDGGAATHSSAQTSPAQTSPAQISPALDAPARVSPAAGGRPIYTVRVGDSSLSVVLERRFGTYKRSLPLVKTLNPGLNPNQIRVGMQIVLPRADEIPGGVSVASASTPSTSRSSTGAASAAVTPRREFTVR